ncbi:DUF421 domain-containing protein [Mucilaginibacter sp. Mucisp86]|uniref:DUF421 domain-containing protein n=1 Tax=Mucilaginibacter sp. Mucisp86 TaxID=3243060 RepID=UPI0039B6D216
MDVLVKIFGEGKDLNAFQMSSRGAAVFLIALLLIRISGRRSFGVRGPLDNIITITLGAVLSRAIVGASPFIPVIITCFVIVALHRGVAWLITSHNIFAKLIQGEKILLYEKGRFIEQNMKRAQLNHEDLMQGVRKSALTEDLSTILKVYIERNGEITTVKKEE